MYYERYEKIRTAAGRSDTEIAAAAGIPRATISDWKLGKSTPKVDKMKAIADVLGVTIDELIKEE